MKGSTIVEKLSEDFDLLAEFKLIQKCLQPTSYTQSVELEVMAREMMVYEYPMANQWALIDKFGARKLNLHQPPTHP